jgi:hypothetical protein
VLFQDRTLNYSYAVLFPDRTLCYPLLFPDITLNYAVLFQDRTPNYSYAVLFPDRTLSYPVLFPDRTLCCPRSYTELCCVVLQPHFEVDYEVKLICRCPAV